MAAIRLVVIANLLLLGATQVAAQALPPPSTATGGLFGRRVVPDSRGHVHEMTVAFDAGSGYDRNRDQEARADQGGVVSAVGAVLSHRVGTRARFLTSSGRAYLSRATVGIEQLSGGSASTRGELAMGRRVGVTVDLGATYEPTFLFNAFGPIEGDVRTDVPGASPPQGISDQRWFSVQLGGGVYQRWTTRQRTDARYSASKRDVIQGIGLESRGKGVRVEHSWDRWRRGGVNFRYRWDDQRQGDIAGFEIPIETHTAEAVLQAGRSLSPTRRFDVSVGGGASRVESLSTTTRQLYVFTMPTISASVRVDLSRSWSLDGAARHDVSVLQSITPLPFRGNAFSVRLAGDASRRVQLAFSGSLANGDSDDGTGAFETVVATAQVQFAMSRHIAVFGGGTYYDHDVRDVVLTAPGFPGDFRRGSVRMGVTYWLPVFGRF